MIKVEGVTKRYGSATAVNNVSFSVERGEIVGFLGPNGAGKTTTMRILTGFLPPTEGAVVVGGYDVQEEPIEVKKRIGYLPETPPLYPEMDVDGYLRFVARLKGIAAGDTQRRIDAVIDRTSIGGVKNKLIGNLSKGYRQRVGLAQALIHSPEVLVLDEPTSGLDPKQIIEVRELIRSLAGEHTIILSTHILSEVSGTCGRVIIINEGRIEADDTPENLTSQLQGAQAVQLTVEGPEDEVVSRLMDIPGVKAVSCDEAGDRLACRVEAEKDSEVPRRLAAAVVNAGWGLYAMQSLGLSLEDIFLKLTDQDAAADDVEAIAEPQADEPAAEPVEPTTEPVEEASE